MQRGEGTVPEGMPWRKDNPDPESTSLCDTQECLKIGTIAGRYDIQLTLDQNGEGLGLGRHAFRLSIRVRLPVQCKFGTTLFQGRSLMVATGSRALCQPAGNLVCDGQRTRQPRRFDAEQVDQPAMTMSFRPVDLEVRRRLPW